MRRPMIGINASNSPKTTPTLSRVGPSMPVRPMPIAPAKLLSPTETLTSKSPSSPDIWLAANYMEPGRGASFVPFCSYSLTTTHCPSTAGRRRMAPETCTHPCNPRLGSQSLKPYNPPGQEAHEGQTKKLRRAVDHHARQHDRPGQTHIHFECGVRDP